MPKPGLRAGDEFGHYTVVGFDRNKHKYECRCVCGKIKFIVGKDLKNGDCKSCGCKKVELMSQFKQTGKTKCLDAHESSKRAIYRSYKHSASKRGHEFELTTDELNSIISKTCTYCGTEPATAEFTSVVRKHGNIGPFLYNGIDRVDNKKRLHVRKLCFLL